MALHFDLAQRAELWILKQEKEHENSKTKSYDLSKMLQWIWRQHKSTPVY